MAKLRGAAKAAFLRRINKGRIKAGLKTIKSKTKTHVRKAATRTRKVISTVRRKTRRNVTRKPKKQGKRKSNNMVSLGKFKTPKILKDVLMGFGAGAVVTFALGLVGQQALGTNPAVKAISGFVLSGGSIVSAIVALIAGSNVLQGLGGQASGAQTANSSGLA